MSDRPFISRELDRRIASAEAAIAAGRIDPAKAETALKPWAAAEAWLAGHPFFGISPRNGDTHAFEICPIEQAIDALASARDRLAAEIENRGRLDLIDHWRCMSKAVRQLEFQRDGMAAFRAMSPAAPADPTTTAQPAVSSAPASLLADMFDADGKPLPLPSRRAA